MSSVLCVVVVRGILQHDERVVLLGCDHDLVLLASYADKLHIVVWVERLDGGLGLRSELGDERAVLDGVVLGHGGADSNAARVYHDDAFYSLVGVDAVDGLFYFLGLKRERI